MLIQSDDTLVRHLAANAEAEVYAFDLFDTLVGRLLPPEYVKFLVCVYLQRRWLADRPTPDATAIYRTRRAIEDQLKAQAQATGDDPEYAHIDAMRELLAASHLHDPAALADILRFELQLESAVCFVHTPVAAAIRDLHARRRSVILISDNYLSAAQLRTLLEPTGLLPLLTAIHVSSTTRRRKDTGRLFEQVLRELNLPPARLMHIGDNPHSDEAIPRRLGIPALLIELPGEAQRRRTLEAMLPVDPPPAPDPARLAAALALTVRTRCRALPSAAVDMALALAAPFNAYTASLLMRARELRVNTVFFLAREGHLLRTLFDQASAGTVASAYVHASRVSTHLLALPALTRDTLESSFNAFEAHELWRVSAAQLLDFFKIDSPANRAIIEAYGLPPTRRLDLRTPAHRDALARPLLDPRLRAAFASTRDARKSLFADYLDQLGLTRANPVLVADIGWAGSMQTFIADFLREFAPKTPVHGYYFGYDQVWEHRKGVQRARPDLVKDAWICQRSPDDKEAGLIVSRIVLELAAMAPHGTTCAYRREGTQVVPVCEWLPGEERQYTQRIAPLQRALLEATTLTAPLQRALPDLMPAADLERYTLRTLAQFLSHPPRAVARYFIPTALFDNHFGTQRRVAFGPGMWWGEAVAALGLRAWPWRASHVLHQLAPHVREGARRVALCLAIYGPAATLRQLAHRLVRGSYCMGTDFAITAQYRFQRTPAPPPPPTPLRPLYWLTNGADRDAVRAALPHLALSPDDAADLLYHAGGEQFNLARVRDRLTITEEALTPAEAAAHLASCDIVVITRTTVRFDADFLAHMQAAFARAPAPDLVYTDNDTLMNGQFTRPRFKPDWSPEYYLEFDYIGPVVALRRAALGNSPLNLLTRLAQHGVHAALLEWLTPARPVVHVPAVLVHAPYPNDTAPAPQRLLAAHAHYGNAVTIGANLAPALRNPPPISIIIPFRNKLAYLKRCVDSIERVSTYRNYELLLVDNQSDEPALRTYLDSLRGHARIRVMPYNHPFNYARLNNAAVAEARHPVILLLNNDTEVLEPAWLEAMLAHTLRPEVGCVGAKLLYPNRTIQHAGVVFDFDQTYPAAHIFHRVAATDAGYERRLQTTQEYAAVTAACLMLRRDVFDAVTGFDPTFEVAYNDLDLCCRIRARGLKIIWTPAATLVHHENVSRGNPLESAQDRDERDRFRTRWRHLFPTGDPCYSPHLHLGGSVKSAR